MSAPAGLLLLRADASRRIGTGHWMRCLALAQAWADAGGSVLFAGAEVVPALLDRARADGFKTASVPTGPGGDADAEQTAALARAHRVAAVVVDGYDFSARYQHALRRADCPLVVIDDYGHAENYAADLILNQNLYATANLYERREPYTRLLLGLRYLLLRREFTQWLHWQRTIPGVARKILVTLGGADPDNVTYLVVRGLQQVRLPGLEVLVLIGAGNPHAAELAAVIAGHPSMRLQVDAADMPALMSWADIGITAGGTTSWEQAFMSLPGVVLIMADNQRLVAHKLGEVGAAVNLGEASELTPGVIAEAVTDLADSPARRAAASRVGRELIDGQGSRRVVHAIREVLR